MARFFRPFKSQSYLWNRGGSRSTSNNYV